MVRRTTSRQLRSRAGFTLLELLVSLLVLSLVMAATLELFDGLNRLSRVQVNVADLQQSLRVAQQEMVSMIRMAGRGGLRAERVLGGPAVVVRNGVGLTETSSNSPSREVAIGWNNTPEAMEGSDILVVRGVFNSRVFLLDWQAEPSPYQQSESGGIYTGTLQVTSRTPTGLDQDLQVLRDMIDDEVPEALVLVNAQQPHIYGVVQFDPSHAANNSSGDTITLGITTGDQYGAQYALLSSGGVFPSALGAERVTYIGILEEYRYYVRDDDVVIEDVDGDGTPDTRKKPTLSRARMFPGTEVPYGSTAAEQAANLRGDIADYIFDLQVALGFDTNLGGGYFDMDTDNEDPDDRLVDTEDDQDDWFYNSIDDDPAERTWSGVPPWDDITQPGVILETAVPRPRLYYVRLSTLARSESPDLNIGEPEDLLAIEDHEYTTDPDDLINGDEAKRFRRQLVETVVDLRNVGGYR